MPLIKLRGAANRLSPLTGRKFLPLYHRNTRLGCVLPNANSEIKQNHSIYSICLLFNVTFQVRNRILASRLGCKKQFGSLKGLILPKPPFVSRTNALLFCTFYQAIISIAIVFCNCINVNVLSSRIHQDKSFHCEVCNVCLDKRLEGNHKCRPDSGHDECCICLEVGFYQLCSVTMKICRAFLLQ